MKASIKDNTLLITIPISESPRPSASGKTLVIVSTQGNKPTTIKVQDKILYIGVNAYIYR